jgi:hypothetical protein
MGELLRGVVRQADFSALGLFLLFPSSSFFFLLPVFFLPSLFFYFS